VADPQERFISAVVGGKTFADVGGLWGTVNEKISVAHRHGATTLTMVDITPLSRPSWVAFHDRMQSFGIASVQCLSEDIMLLGMTEDPPTFDVVHCSGVLYHIPNPIGLLVALHRVVQKHLILTSSISDTVIENAAGRLIVPNGAALFLPGLNDDEFNILKAHWEPVVGDQAAGLTRRTAWDPANFGPWWWLPTIDCLKAMCCAVGFTCVDEAPTWNNLAHTLLLVKQS
jgi:hypothetical protein